MISIWLSGISCSYGPNTPDSPLDTGIKAEALPNSILATSEESTIRHNRSTKQLGTGLDGPLSSEGDKLSKMLRDGLSDVKESNNSADLSISSQRLKSNTSGSSDWEKNWEKRKPRRKHDVSEVAQPGFTAPTGPATPSSAATSHIIDSGGSVDEDESNGKSDSYSSHHDAQLHTIKQSGANSCPELRQQLEELDISFPALKTRDGERPISKVRFDLSKNLRRRHFNVRNLVTKQFRSIGRRLRHTGSSNFSVRSDFPDPPGSRERRLLARDSADIWPSSGDETPLFNTPESNISSIHTTRTHLDPLAMAGIMIATAELDRLTPRGSLERASRTSRSSTGASRTSPTEVTPLCSGSASPDKGASPSNSTVLDMPPVPFNTPTTPATPSSIPSPIPRTPSQRRGQRRRAQRSRLSEVTTPDEVASPAEPTEDFTEHPLSFPYPQFETLPECSAAQLGGNEHGMYPKPLAVNRGSSEVASPQGDEYREWRRQNSIPSVSITPPEKSSSLLRSSSGFSDSLETVSPPARVSSIGKTRKSMYGLKVPENVHDHPRTSTSLGLGHTGTSLAILSDIGLPASMTEVFRLKKPGSAANRVHHTSSRNVTQAVSEETAENHGRYSSATRSRSYGEQGNLEPFYLPGYRERMREDSVETTYTVVISKGAESSEDDDPEDRVD
ncbi:hypothetical protein GGR52DRAFT_99662 [Hypoxylon sp. FL1284]|nr:hypothetical protein GGR52DRAFT_99662 [Hypoxylon sp. FL1284]